MQGVHEAVRGDGAAGGDQRLAGDLAAEDALRADRRAHPAEGHLVALLQVQHLEELVDGGLTHDGLPHAHCSARTVAASTSEPSSCTRRVLVEPGTPGGLPATMTM